MPKNFTGQMVLLIGFALLMAQLINFALLYQERRNAIEERIINPAIIRLVDAIERMANGDPLPEHTGHHDFHARRRAFLSSQPLVEVGQKRAILIEKRLREAVNEVDAKIGNVRAALLTPDQHIFSEPSRPARASHRILLLSVEIAPQKWLNLRAPFRAIGPAFLGGLIVQTLVIFILLLLAVLWASRRAARPLQALTRAADAFGQGVPIKPVDEKGPADIQSLIAAFNAMQKRLGAMLEEKDRMLGAIGHDLRTPLASLRLRIENVEEESERQKMAETIEEMNHTLDDILSLARIGRSDDPAILVDLAAMVDAVVEDLRALGQAVVFVETDRPRVRARPAPTRRALRNVIENAVKYGGGAEVRLQIRHNEAVISILDEGPGIADADLERVMEGFVRLEASRNRNTGGSGLGLTIARAILREQGGDLRLMNRDTRGLCVELSLRLG